MEYQFKKDQKQLVAVDAGWKENGHSVFEVEDADGGFIDTVMVHPFDSIENAVAEWIKAN
jgi:hypothetical protein